MGFKVVVKKIRMLKMKKMNEVRIKDRWQEKKKMSLQK